MALETITYTFCRALTLGMQKDFTKLQQSFTSMTMGTCHIQL